MFLMPLILALGTLPAALDGGAQPVRFPVAQETRIPGTPSWKLYRALREAKLWKNVVGNFERAEASPDKMTFTLNETWDLLTPIQQRAITSRLWELWSHANQAVEPDPLRSSVELKTRSGQLKSSTSKGVPELTGAR